MKAQLQIEIQKNNEKKNNDANIKKYFTNRELGIISNKMINIVTSQAAQMSQDKDKPKNKKSENVIDFMDSVEIMNSKPEGKDEMTQTQEESNYYKDFYDENKGSYRGRLNSNPKQSKRDSRNDKNYQKKELSLKNEDYIDRNRRKNKLGFNDKGEEDEWDNFMPRNKREESLKRAMKRLEYKKKRDEEKNKYRKSEKITGMAGDLEEALNKGDGRLYVGEDYEQNRDDEEEYDDNYYE